MIGAVHKREEHQIMAENNTKAHHFSSLMSSNGKSDAISLRRGSD